MTTVAPSSSDITPSVEELYFRGYLLPRLALRQGGSLDQPHTLRAPSPLAALALSDGLRRARHARLPGLVDTQPAH
jgi:hypothetical protein